MSSETNKGVWVGRVPAEAGTVLPRASRPAKAITSTIGRNRPTSMAAAKLSWKNVEVTVSPAKALPLLLAAEA